MKTTKKGSSGNITPLKKVVTVVDKEEVTFWYINIECLKRRLLLLYQTYLYNV